MKINKLETSQSTATWALFLTVHSMLMRQMASALKAADLPPLEWYDVLWTLECSPTHRLRMHELAHLILLSRSNLTRLIDRLESSGLVKREPSADDKRGAHCVLKPAGIALRKKMWSTYQKCIFEMFNEHISEKEDAVLHTVLCRILGVARDAVG